MLSDERSSSAPYWPALFFCRAVVGLFNTKLKQKYQLNIGLKDLGLRKYVT